MKLLYILFEPFGGKENVGEKECSSYIFMMG